MLNLSVIHLFIIGVFLIATVQSRICSKEVTKTRAVVEPVSHPQQIEDENNGTTKTLTKSKIRHVKKTHTITYCCREEDDTEISLTECIKDCKANCEYGHCKKGSCVCSYGFLLINNNCVDFCDICRASNGTCMALLLCECKSGSYVGQACPNPDLISSTTTKKYDEDFREIDSQAAFMKSIIQYIYNDTVPTANTEINDNDGMKKLNYTHNSTRFTTPSLSMKSTMAHSYEAKESLRTTAPPLNVTQHTSAANHVNSNSTELEQGSATFRIQHNGVSILISILLGNHTCGNQDTLLADAPSRN